MKWIYVKKGQKIKEKATHGNGIYLYNKITKDLDYMCYSSNIDNSILNKINKITLLFQIFNDKVYLYKVLK